MRQLLLTCFVVLSVNHLFALTDDYRVMWRADPATTMVIGWNQVSGTSPMVYYGMQDFGTNYLMYPNTKTADVTVVQSGMNNHFARLTGLLPNKAYYFVIADSEGNSVRMWFKTTPDVQTERLSFIAGGDSRNNRIQRQNANKLVAKLRPHAVFFGGDYTSSGTDTQWQEWFEDWQLTIGTDGRIIPIVATRGNHESNNAIVVNFFDVPSADVYFNTRFADNLVSAYTLNTEITISGTQTSWLSSELAADDAVYKMAQYHKPVRSHNSAKAEGTNQYAFWVPLFDQHKLSLVVECDSHTSKSTWPILASNGAGNVEGFVRDDLNGVVYVGEGCWGAPLRAADDAKIWTRDSGQFNQFKWIFIDLEQIEVRTIKVDNADLVGQVSDDNIFAPPANLDIHNPANGSIIIIPNEYPCASIELDAYQTCLDTTIPSVLDNLSGVTYSEVTQTLFGVLNNPTKIIEMDLAGNLLREITLSGFNDTEGIAHLGNHEFLVTEEVRGRMVFVTIPPSPNNTIINYPAASEYIQMEGDWSANVGMEGIAYDKTYDVVYFCKEKSPIGLYRLANPIAKKGTTQPLEAAFDLATKALEYPTGAGTTFTDIAGLAWSAGGSLILLSHEGQSMIEVNPLTGQLLSYQDLTPYNMTQPEGICVFGDDEVYIVGESNEVYHLLKDCNGPCLDGDYDGVCDTEDNCPTRSNWRQTDADGNGIGDACEIITVTTCVQVASGLGDVEQNGVNNTIYSNSSDLELVNDGSRGNQLIGIEFLNLNIPKEAMLQAASIQFTSDAANSNVDPCDLMIRADASPNPVSISTTDNDIGARIPTVNIVPWSPPIWVNVNFAGPNQLTPDLTTIVQEVMSHVNTGGMLSSMVFMISGTGKRRAYSYEGSNVGAASLCIEYTVPYACSRELITAENENRWIGPLTANWYDHACNWSKNTFPTECDDVVIENADITVRGGATAYGYTLETIVGATLTVELGGEMCIVANE